MADRKFDTCFFERYAKLTLEKFLGDRYSSLVNEDRPDLQSTDHSLGIEVTRAMESNKNVADALLMEMAGIAPAPSTCQATGQQYPIDHEDYEKIISSGYAYGLQQGRFIGQAEYDYWRLAHPLRRIIENKVAKVGSGFYGRFDEYGLYIFCKDVLPEQEISLTVDYIMELQMNLDIRYSSLYLSLLDNLYVCDLTIHDPERRLRAISRYGISSGQCREFFIKALGK
ncbi:MAG: hypothetical protein NC115_10360 [Bacteroidales bacterium]|nr:hypothetical protein [Bacteroidales bacterium]